MDRRDMACWGRGIDTWSGRLETEWHRKSRLLDRVETEAGSHARGTACES